MVVRVRGFVPKDGNEDKRLENREAEDGWIYTGQGGADNIHTRGTAIFVTVNWKVLQITACAMPYDTANFGKSVDTSEWLCS